MRPTFLLPLLLIIAANTHLAVWGQETKTSLNRHAFIIGINDYTYEPDLAFCEADAQRLKTVLLHGGFEPQNIDILTGTDRPTKSEIFTRLASLLGKIDDRSENLFLFAFSGHGYQKDGERFLCPYDANRDAGEGLLKLGDVFDVLKKNGNVHHCVFLIDACRSSLNRDKAVHDVDDPKTTSHKTITFSKMDLPEELSVYLLSGCTEGNVAREYAELQQGLFMHYVVEGLEGLAKNRRGEVDGHNLFSFVREGMTSFSSRSGAPQTPTILVSARGEQTKNVAITKPQGVSYWPKRPTAKGATFGTRMPTWSSFRA